jgi:hypothetical protein
MDTHFTIIKEKNNNPNVCYNFPPANIYLYLYFQNLFEKENRWWYTNIKEAYKL